MAVKISPADNQVNIVRLECEYLKWIPFGSESVFSDVNTTMNSSFSWKEVNLAIWLKLLLLFGSTPFECCPDMVCPTESFTETFHENAKCHKFWRGHRHFLTLPVPVPQSLNGLISELMEIVIVRTTEERIKLN